MTTNLLSVIEQLVGALDDAATSLETISRLAGKTHYVGNGGERVETYMGHHDQVRGYAISRASAARAALSRAQAAPAVGVPDADLQARCKEILSWQRTGILPDGALRTYAGSKDYSERHDCLQIAEAATAKEAFEYIASAQPQQKEG